MEFKKHKCFAVTFEADAFNKTISVLAADFDQAMRYSKLCYFNIVMNEKMTIYEEVEDELRKGYDVDKMGNSQAMKDLKKFERFSFEKIVILECKEIRGIYIPINENIT